MSTGGEVANALVCKTSIHGFKSHSVLHKINNLYEILNTASTHDKALLGVEKHLSQAK